MTPLALVALVACGPLHDGPAELQLVSQVAGVDGVEVEVCPDAAACRTLDLAQGQQQALRGLPVGGVVVRVDTGRARLTRRFTLGPDGRYVLALHGRGDAPVDRPWSARAARWLGGAEAPPSGPTLGARVFVLDPPDPERASRVRLVALAPGAELVLEAGHGSTGAVGYGTTSDPVRLDDPLTPLAVRLDAGPGTLADGVLSVAPGGEALVFAGPLHGMQVPLVVVGGSLGEVVAGGAR